MKHLIAPRITLDTDPAPRDVSALMDKAGVQTNVIGTINWAAFPYRPAVKFRIAHTGSTILLHYTVGERMTRAVYGDDLGQVWTDSCVEFFSSPADDGCYYNLETNCIGTVLLCRGTSREGREPAPAEALAAIGRYSTLGRKPFAEHPGLREPFFVQRRVLLSLKASFDVPSRLAVTYYEKSHVLNPPL